MVTPWKPQITWTVRTEKRSIILHAPLDSTHVAQSMQARTEFISVCRAYLLLRQKKIGLSRLCNTEYQRPNPPTARPVIRSAAPHQGRRHAGAMDTFQDRCEQLVRLRQFHRPHRHVGRVVHVFRRGGLDYDTRETKNREPTSERTRWATRPRFVLDSPAGKWLRLVGTVFSW